MTYPALGFTPKANDANTQSLLVDLPAVSIGDLLVVRGSVNDLTDFTFPAGFVPKFDEDHNGTFKACIYVKPVTEAAAASQIVVASTAATQGIFVASKYEVAEWSGSLNDFVVSTPEKLGSGTAGNPPALTMPGNQDDCFFESIVFWRTGDVSCTGFPANLTDNNLNYQSANASGGAGLALATLSANASSFDADGFTLSSSAPHISLTFGIKTTPSLGASVDNSNPEVGDTITGTLVNCTGPITIVDSNANAVTLLTQDASSFTFDFPDIRTFGSRHMLYGTSETFTVTDSGNGDATTTFSITPAPTHQFGTAAGAPWPTTSLFSRYTTSPVVDGNQFYYEGLGELAGQVLPDDGDVAGLTLTSGTHYYNIWWYESGAWDAGESLSFTLSEAGEIDDVPPVITLTGNNPLTLAQGSPYVEPGFTAVDDTDGDIAADVIVTGAVDENTLGSYVLSYNVVDAAGNPAVQVQRTVNVVDVTAPVITLLGANPLTLAQGSPYVEPGFTAVDDTDGDIAANVVVTGAVDENTLGSYVLSYNVVDSAGNPAVQVQRTVNVVDVTAPVITLTGSASITLIQGVAYADPGYTAVDNNDGDITADVVVTGTVNSMALGDQVLSYNVSDAAGNPAAQVQRTVTVVSPLSLEPIDARIFCEPAASDANPGVLYAGNSNYVIVADIIGAFSKDDITVAGATCELKTDSGTLYGPVSMVLLGAQWVAAIPYAVDYTDVEYLTAVIDLDAIQGAQAYWEIPLAVESRLS